MKQSKVAFVIPYIGTFRKDFPLFLNSCKENPSVDFLFFCDNTEQYGLNSMGAIYMFTILHSKILNVVHKACLIIFKCRWIHLINYVTSGLCME